MVIILSIVLFLIIVIVDFFFFFAVWQGKSKVEQSGGRQASVHSFHTGQTQMMKCDVEKKKAPGRRQEFLNNNQGQDSVLLGNYKTNPRFLSLQPRSDEIKRLTLGCINVREDEKKKKGGGTDGRAHC